MVRKTSRVLWTNHLNQLAKNSFIENKALTRGCLGTILGIDPSLRGTGIAVIKSENKKIYFMFSEQLKMKKKLSFYDCLGEIFCEISEILKKFSPEWVAIEQTIFVQNHRVAQILGSVRGAIIAAIASEKVKIYEYLPLRIKQSVTGVGKASKVQVMRTVKNILSIDHEISFDEADALAVACCHAWTYSNS